MLFLPHGHANFGAIQTTLTGQPVNSAGIVATPVVGSKGAWVTAFATLDNDTYGLTVWHHTNFTAAANRTYVVDIGVGAAGSEVVVIPNIIASNAGAIDGRMGMFYFFPIFIPAGTRVAVRSQGNVTTTVRTTLYALQRPAYPTLLKTVGAVEVIGLTGITGTSLTAGTTSEGAWTSLGTTSRQNWWWQLGAQVPAADVAHVNTLYLFDIAYGDTTNKILIAEHIPFVTSTNEEATKPLYTMSCERVVPAGSTIYVRGQSAGTNETLEVAVYGGA